MKINNQAISCPSERTEWEHAHGVKPFPVVYRDPFSNKGSQARNAVMASPEAQRRLHRFVIQAKALIESDYATIDHDAELTRRTKLEHICERMKTEAHFLKSDHVCFDPEEGRFWIYPKGKR